jgi:DNA recombination protein RmuC
MANSQLITILFLVVISMCGAILSVLWVSWKRNKANASGEEPLDIEAFTKVRVERDERTEASERLRSELKIAHAALQKAIEEKGKAEQKAIDLERGQTERETRMRKEFDLIARDILEENAQRHQKDLANNGKKTLEDVLNPMKERFSELQKQMKEFYGSEREQLGQLDKELEKLFKLNQSLQTDAQNLTSALKGDSKVQGDWGEYQLERILEQVGLVEGTHFSKQSTVKNEDGRSMRPDFLIHLPDEKVLVIDSKVSLTAYERLTHAENAEEQKLQAKLHVQSVQKHIRELGAKNYAQLYGRSTDYALMFVPVEAAWMALGKALPELQEEGLRKNVLLVSTSTLIATLRTISYVWQQEEQKANIQRIADRGGKLYDQLNRFVNSLLDVGKKLGQANASYDEALKRLKTGKGSAIRQAEMMRELGVPVKSSLPEELLDQSDTWNAAAEIASTSQEKDSE